MKSECPIEADWRWGTAEGSREFDRLIDRAMSFREKVEWLEEAESLAILLQEQSRPGAPAKEIRPDSCKP